jgi:hypothetical protein
VRCNLTCHAGAVAFGRILWRGNSAARHSSREDWIASLACMQACRGIGQNVIVFRVLSVAFLERAAGCFSKDCDITWFYEREQLQVKRRPDAGSGRWLLLGEPLACPTLIPFFAVLLWTVGMFSEPAQ